MIPLRTHLAAYAALSAVYLLYLPDALPMLDDWVYLQLWDQAHAGGLHGIAAYLTGLLDNTYNGNLRLNWLSYLPAFLLSSVAGHAGWPYFLLAWVVHWLTAVLLCRVLSEVFEDPETGFLAGAVYAVLPSSNYVLFGPLSASFYYFQSLLFLWWFHATWKARTAHPARVAPVVFSGEQILPALLLLVPLPRHRFLRSWLLHAATIAVLLGAYVLLINQSPLLPSIGRRYDIAQQWSLKAFNFFLVGSLGFAPDFVGWRPVWRPEPALLVCLALAAAALIALFPRPQHRNRQGELLLWSIAGAVLTYLPVARLASMEYRYLYVPALFLVSTGAALLSFLPRRVRLILGPLLVLYCLSYTYFEMRQAWTPQSRIARAALDAARLHGPFRPDELVVFSGGPLQIGPAPAFITGASWSFRSLVPPATGARDLVAGDHGELYLFQGDTYLPITPADLGRLRAFTLDSTGRFVPNPSPIPRRVSSHEIALRIGSSR
jgi:hypothetical protein